MFCRFCGSSVKDDSVFCKYCGKQLTDAVEDTQRLTLSANQGDLIIMRCPTCGGSLKIAPAMNSYKCEFCGTECLVRRESGNVTLEAFACCPTCHRNDRSVKASMKFGNPTKPEISAFETHRTGFAAWLLYIVGTSLGLGGLAGFGLIFTKGPDQIPMSLFLFFLGVVAFWFGHKYESIDRESTQEINEIIAEENEEILSSYEKGMGVWNNSYYCERDGTIYDIKENKIHSLQELKGLIYPDLELTPDQ